MNLTDKMLPGVTPARATGLPRPCLGGPAQCERLLEELCGAVTCDAFDAEPLRAEVRWLDLGRLRCGHLRWNGHRLRRSGASGTWHADHSLAIVLRAGCALVLQDSRIAVLRTGDFALIHLDREFELCFDRPATMHLLRMPRSWLDHQGLPMASIGAVTVPAGGAAARLLACSLDAIESKAAVMSEASQHSLADAVASLVGCGLQDGPASKTGADALSGVAHRARIVTHVRENLRDPELSVAMVARSVGLSEDYIGKLFRGQTMSLSRWIWHLRLNACARDLRDPRFASRTAGEIGFSWGFNDASHFTRRFRDRYGMPPGEWRQCHVGTVAEDERRT